MKNMIPMDRVRTVLLVMGCASFLSFTAAGEKNIAGPFVKPGIEVLVKKNAEIIKGKRVGLITNVTGIDSNIHPSVDILYSLPDVKLTALFAPEHGIRGGIIGYSEDETDEKTGIKVFSIRTKGPTEEMLEGLDVLLFDIQDIGTRSYTYISTMKNCMDSAAKYKIPFVVLDRPNPIGGLVVDGPVLDMEFQSFVGVGPLAYVHGMTIGEIAGFFNEELKINCKLTVVKMEGWKREMYWEDTGLNWVPTSPHIPEPDTPQFYPITGILGELSLVNIGVGYTLPFKVVGAPYMDAEKIAGILNSRKIDGIYFQPFHFTPFYDQFEKQMCNGFRLIITDRKKLLPVAAGYHIIEVLLSEYPEHFNFKFLLADEKGKMWKIGMFDRVNGTDLIRKQFQMGIPAEGIISGYQPALQEFIEKRKKYLLY
jgi:uncharacterized protein YbbC (DUF1343 family)